MFVVRAIFVLALFVNASSSASASPFAYVPTDNLKMSVIDLASNTVVTTVPVNQAPFGAVVTPAGSKMLVANYYSASLQVVDTSTNSVSATITGVTNPAAVAVNPAETHAYVTDYLAAAVRVVNLTTNTITASIGVQTNPWGIAVNPAGTRAYVANNASGTVSVLDLSTNTNLTNIVTNSFSPLGVAIHPAGTRVYVGNYSGNVVSVIDTATNTVLTNIAGINRPFGMAVNAAGTRLYVAREGTSGAVAVVDTATNTVLTNISVGNFPQGLSLTPDGNYLYVNNATGNTISVASTATNTVVATITPADGVGANSLGMFIGPFCPSGCTDGNLCTVDACNMVGGCSSSPTAGSCDDGLFCNGTDTCSAGSCNHSGDPCVGGGECSDTCDEQADNCLAPVGTPCTSDSNVCTDDICDAIGTCAHTPNASPCDDEIFCNGTDICSAGSCGHSGDPCVGGGECSDACNEATDDCLETAGTPCSSDSNICTDDACNATGDCAHTANTSSCDDGLFCNGTDTCASGTCGHSGDPCVGGPQCANTCDEDANACYDPDGTPCDDGAACTLSDQCMSGICTGNSMTCGDSNVQAGCGEECDDGGFVTDDGCDDTCHFEPCKPEPDPTCKQPFAPQKAAINLKKDADDPTRSSAQWKWTHGTQTDKADFGDPIDTDDYWLCIYDANTLVSTTRVAPGGTCNGKPCWSEKTKGFQYKARTPGLDGATNVGLVAGTDGKAKALFRAKGAALDLPDPATVTGPLVVQLVRPRADDCWSATYSAPFTKQDEESLKDKSD